MEAPEKIYLTKNLLGELFDGWDALPSDDFINIEYTRTDVFIEKACDWLRYYINPTAGTYLFNEDIEKFRKAMKGE